MAINVTDVITEWGAVYKDGGQGVKDIQVKFFQKSETEALLSPVPTVNTVLEKASAEITRVLQRYQKAFTPLGNTSFKPRKIPLTKLKIDLEEVPDDLEISWLGFLASNDLDRSKWPFVKWWLEVLALNQAQEDFEKLEIFSGVQGAITPGTATAAGTQIDGIRKVINDGVTAGTINKIVMGAPPTDAKLFVAYVEDYYKQIPDLYKNDLDKIFMSPSNLTLFKQGMREKYNINYAQVNDLTKIIDTNIQVVGPASHVGTKKLWTTIKNNAVIGTKKPGNEKIFKVETAKRAVTAYTDFYKGFGYWIPEWVWTNDQDLV